MSMARSKSAVWVLQAAFCWKFAAQSGSCDMSVCISPAQARTTLHPALGPRHFCCKFSHKMALVTWLRRLAQTVRPDRGPWHFSWKFSTCCLHQVPWACLASGAKTLAYCRGLGSKCMLATQPIKSVQNSSDGIRYTLLFLSQAHT